MRKIISGIYCIENIVNNKKYIGYAVDIHTRWNRHKNELSKNIHVNNALQRAYNKYGKDNFIYYIIQELDKDINILSLMEIYWIAYFDSFIQDKRGYNLTRGGDGGLGHTMSEESKKQLSLSKMGIHPSEETRKKLSEWERTPEMRKKISESKKGTQAGENNPNFGKHLSDEHKKILSEKRKGTKLSEERKKKTSIILQGEKRQKNTSSKYVGIYFDKRRNKWVASIFFFKDRIHIGYFKYEVEAALAYNEFALELYGEKAKLNNISQEEIDNLWNQE